MRLTRPAPGRPAVGPRRHPLGVVAVAGLLALSGCGDDGTAAVTAGAADAGSPEPTTSATVDGDAAAPASTPSPVGEAPSAPTEEEEAAATPPAPAGGAAPTAAATAAPFEADLRPDSAEPEGHGLTVTDVAVGTHEGYDRVVFTLGGEGVPGWQVAYVDQPTRQASGEPVQVAGAAFLSVLVTGVGYPYETGVEELTGQEITPSGTAVVREVELGSTHEGQYDAAVGLTDAHGFRVFRLDGPPRVVIDVLHAS